MDRADRERASTGISGDRRGRGFFPGGAASAWALLLAIVLLAHLLVPEGALRLAMLRVVLVATASAEALAFLTYELRPRRFAEQAGRPYDPAYHGLMQDFGFYNLGFALLLALAAVSPADSTSIIGAVVASYVVHASTHFLRYLGFYFGGGHAIPTRPREFELRDGLQLAVSAVGMIAFFP